MSDPMITVQDVTKIYNLYRAPIDRFKEALHPRGKKYHEPFYALKNANLTIERGQSVGIIGMNGSGKSTLLKIISGVITPNSGQIQIHGKISALLELGAGFNPEFTGLENAYFQCSLQGFDRKKTEEIIPGILEFADIGDFIYQPVKTYSSGMYVRLAFSLAVSIEPDILIVDEALAVGDAYFQAKCIQRIKTFMASGKTLLFVSHDPGAVQTLCSKAYLLHKGEVVDEGDPKKVFNYYNGLIAEKDAGKSKVIHKETLRERSGNKRVEIMDVQISTQDGKSLETFVSGERITIKVTLKANDTVTDPTVGILIKDRLGNDIFGTNNAHMQIPIGCLERGDIVDTFYQFDLNLGPNIYTLTAAAHTDETHIHENFDWINSAVVFKVIPSTDLRFLGYCRLVPKFSYTSHQKELT